MTLVLSAGLGPACRSTRLFPPPRSSLCPLPLLIYPWGGGGELFQELCDACIPKIPPLALGDWLEGEMEKARRVVGGDGKQE